MHLAYFLCFKFNFGRFENGKCTETSSDRLIKKRIYMQMYKHIMLNTSTDLYTEYHFRF